MLLYLKFICWVRRKKRGGDSGAKYETQGDFLSPIHPLPNFEPPDLTANLDGSSQKDTFRPCMVGATSDPSALKADIISSLKNRPTNVE